ncbi:MAG TPA: hypothetical protein VGO52_00140 [Hyphomonadaceae bacterium]|nr:hypothetical protein [Hyphomonadaceae bacterium]
MDILDTTIDNEGVTLRQFLRVAAVVLVLASLPTAHWAWQRERDLSAIRTYWVEATATVLKGTDDVRRSHGRRHKALHDYYLTLQWTDQAGRTLTVTRGVNAFLFSRVAQAPPEARVPIRYLPGSSDLAPVITDDFFDASNTYLYGAAALLALGLSAAWFSWPPRRATAVAAV